MEDGWKGLGDQLFQGLVSDGGWQLRPLERRWEEPNLEGGVKMLEEMSPAHLGTCEGLPGIQTASSLPLPYDIDISVPLLC